ncbi:hypothetical protein ACNQ1X_02590 [Mycoplasma sp. SK341A]|uniref:hypothetical protein n=1 Tax=unclassified Mycoplasma TaxID=2683645 RepID=UPI003AADF608
MKSKNSLTSYQAYLLLVKKVKIKVGIYGFMYYLLNSLIIIFTLLNGLIAILYLAGASKNFATVDGITYPDNNPYYTDMLNGNSNSNYVIMTTIINASITFLTGLLTFFVINKKYTFYLSKYKILQFEAVIFKQRIFVYKNLDKIKAEFLFYKRCLAIMEVDRFKSSDLTGGYLHG